MREKNPEGHVCENRGSFNTDRRKAMIFHDTVFKKISKEPNDVYSFELEIPEGMTWRAGQFASFRLTDVPLDEGDKDKRTFSIASIPEEGVIRFATKIGEKHTSFKEALLNQVKPGDRISVSDPMGKFSVNEGEDKALLIAGGIGVTPILSVLKAACLNPENTPDMTLIYSENSGVYAFRAFMDEAEKKIPKLGIRYVTNRHVTADMTKEYAEENGNGAVYLISGAPAMGESLSAVIKGAGVSEDKIRMDRFIGY